MKNSPEQTDAQPAYASQPSALRERLLGTLTEPAGVIDVRYAQQKYARIAEWLDRRSELLRQLQARYGVGEGLADDNQPLLMQEHPWEPVTVHSTTAQSFSTGPPSATAGQAIFASERSATPDVPAQPFSPAELTRTFADPATAPASSGESPLPSGEVVSPHTSRRVTDLSQLPAGEFRVSRRRAQFGSSPAPPAAPAPELPLAKTHARTEADDDEPRGSESAAARDAKASEQNVSGAPSRVAPPSVAREVVQTASTQTAPHAPPPALPLAYARPAVSAAEAREGDGSAGERPTGPQPIARTVIDTGEGESIAGERESVAGRRESAVAAEIKGDSFTHARPEIVWREGSTDAPTTDADARGQRRNGGGSPAGNARQVDGHPAERPARQSTQISPPATGQRRGGEIRIDQISPQVIRTISEKVMRAISHDLAVELERRGLKKWR